MPFRTRQRRQARQRVDRARDRRQRADEIGARGIEAAADLRLLCRGQQRTSTDLLQVHAHQIDVGAVDALLGRFLVQRIGVDRLVRLAFDRLRLECLGIFLADQLLWRAVEFGRLAAVLLGGGRTQSVAARALPPVENVDLRRRFFPADERLACGVATGPGHSLSGRAVPG